MPERGLLHLISAASGYKLLRRFDDLSLRIFRSTRIYYYRKTKFANMYFYVWRNCVKWVMRDYGLGFRRKSSVQREGGDTQIMEQAFSVRAVCSVKCAGVMRRRLCRVRFSQLGVSRER